MNKELKDLWIKSGLKKKEFVEKIGIGRQRFWEIIRDNPEFKLKPETFDKYKKNYESDNI